MQSAYNRSHARQQSPRATVASTPQRCVRRHQITRCEPGAARGLPEARLRWSVGPPKHKRHSAQAGAGGLPVAICSFSSPLGPSRKPNSPVLQLLLNLQYLLRGHNGCTLPGCNDAGRNAPLHACSRPGCGSHGHRRWVLHTLCVCIWLRFGQTDGTPACQVLRSVVMRNSFGAGRSACARMPPLPFALTLTCCRRPLPGAGPAFGGKHVLLFVTDQVGRCRGRRGKKMQDCTRKQPLGRAAMLAPHSACACLCLCRSAPPSTSRQAGVRSWGCTGVD